MLYGLPMKWRDTKVLVLRVEHKHKQMNMCIIHHPNSPRSIFHQQEQIKKVLLPAVPTKCPVSVCVLAEASHASLETKKEHLEKDMYQVIQSGQIIATSQEFFGPQKVAEKGTSPYFA